jgi:hypothetical protein
MRLPWRRPSRWGPVVLGIWLIATGVLHLLRDVQIPYAGTALAVLAVAAGILVILER